MNSTRPLTLSPAHRATVEASSDFRADIQGLRALAVSLVLLFHLWPNRLGGGFIGVDVFFVISGFLITSHLVEQAPRSVVDLAGFWARRVRRLLPASFLVLAATLAASRIVGPPTQWDNTARDVRGATFYILNWRLADNSVDYLAAQNAPSPAQHFWSLSVEEQFYLAWPILILLLLIWARKRGVSTWTALLCGLGAVVAASFAYSMWETVHDPARAYFVTPTRIWELGVGGLLAIVLARRAKRGDDFYSAGATPALRTGLLVVGLGLILLAALRYSGATPFPGWQAALPVLGCVLLIGMGPPGRGDPLGWLLTNRSAVWLGGISYSVYLWHWPMIVLLPAVSGNLGLFDKLAIIAVTLVLAALTKTHVEDRFRRVRGLRRTFVAGAVGMACLVSLTMLQIHEVDHRQDESRAAVARALSSDQPCLGAAAMAPHSSCKVTTSGPVLPAPEQAAHDKSAAYDKPCIASDRTLKFRTCQFGDPNGKISIAMVGNSHGVQWLPAVDAVAKASGWRVTSYLVSGCRSSYARNHWPTQRQQDLCFDWGQDVLAAVKSHHFDLVVMANSTGNRAEKASTFEQSQPIWEAGDRKYLNAMTADGTRVVVLRDTPRPPAGNVPDCVAEHPDDLLACAGPRSKAVNTDPLTRAAKSLPGRTQVVDMTNFFCSDDTCYGVIGGVVAYFDDTHMSNTFSKTLAPYLAPRLEKALAAR